MPSCTIPRFHLDVVPMRASVLVSLGGELDLATAPELAETVEELRCVGWDAIVLDLSSAEFVDSAGLRLLLDVQARARDEGWRFGLHGRCEVFERLLSVTGLRDWFTRA